MGYKKIRVALHPKGWANSSPSQLHKISTSFGLKAGLNYAIE